MNRRYLTILCVLYAALVLYGSLMPWDLTSDADAAAMRVHRAMMFWPAGDLHASKIDMFSNFILYVPLGALVAARWRLKAGRSAFAAAAALFCGALLSLCVEGLQAFSPTRISSMNDFMTNSTGAFIGGCAGALCARCLWGRGQRHLRLRWSRRPISLATILLAVFLAADAFFPFLPTLDVSEVWGNVRLSQFSPARGLGLHPWHHWVVLRAGPYGVLAVLLACWSADDRRPRWLRGATGAILFAALTEMGKIFIHSRSANAANVLTSACGAAAAVALGAALRARLSPRGKARLAALLLAVCLVYLQWEPFAFVWDPPAMASKLPSGASWLPLYHYAMTSHVQEAVRLFIRNISLVAALCYSLQLGADSFATDSRWLLVLRAAVLAGFLGFALELGQFLLPSRTPSTTDVFCFALGGALGSWLAHKHLREKLAGEHLPGGSR